jgi:hypothetical protein
VFLNASSVAYRCREYLLAFELTSPSTKIKYDECIEQVMTSHSAFALEPQHSVSDCKACLSMWGRYLG